MAFRDDGQLLLACRALSAIAGSSDAWWTDEGPSEHALLEGWSLDGAPPSGPDRILMLAALGIWRSGGRLPMLDVMVEALEVLMPDYAFVLSTLLAAAQDGPASIDRWLADHAPRSRHTRLRDSASP